MRFRSALAEQMGLHLSLGFAEGQIRRPLVEGFLTVSAGDAAKDVHRFEVDVTRIGIARIVGQTKAVEGLRVPKRDCPLSALPTD